MIEITNHINATVVNLFGVETEIELTRPEPQFGDFSTNVAMKLAKTLGKSPREIAEAIAAELKSDTIVKAEVAGPGFINIFLSDNSLLQQLNKVPSTAWQGKTVVVEYSDPNPFKVLHAGHLYTSIVGDAIANLFENAGGNVHRVNFGGDVGLHVGRTMWAILQELGGEFPEKLQQVPEDARSEWMAAAYVRGNNTYEQDESAKAEMIAINKRVYAIHAEADRQSPLAQIYWTCRQWSYEYFDAFYARIGSGFEKYYPESTVAELGLRTVEEQLANGVFSESDGAVVFKGEDYGLHTRVFINREGLPTYEAKDVGLILTKWNDYHFDKSVVITGNEQEQYMAVVLKAVEQFRPELVQATSHLTHGIVKMQGGVKMSSRKGNILRAVDVIAAAEQSSPEADDSTILGAVKYAFLKQRTGADIIYDPEESVAIEGNSGPYLQYAHARARSIIAKADAIVEPELLDLQADERLLAGKIGEFADVVDKATSELMPHYICTYLYELAQVFNRFYEHNRVIDDERQDIRLLLVSKYADKLKAGLQLLGINAPERM